jgi:hypothetical protein
MKLSSALQLSLILSLSLGTVSGALAAKNDSTAGATTSGSTVIITPELQNADARVQQAGNQLELAKKQLKAAQSILKAADADLKAAKAERQAIALRTQAQGMAQDAGMSPVGNRALAEADSAAVTASHNNSPVMSQTAPAANVNPTPAATATDANTPSVRTQEMPYNPSSSAAPTGGSNALDAVTPELR